MTQVLKPTRVSKSLLLAALLLLPAVAVLGPVEAQVPGQPPVTPPPVNPPACTSRIDRITTTPMYSDAGQTVNVTVRVGTTPAGATGTVDLNVTIEGPDNDEVVHKQTYTLNVPTSKTVSFTAPSGSGLGDIRAEITLPTTSNVQGYCSPANTDASDTWGYWVGKKPDLQVTAVTMVEHFAGTAGNAAHNNTHDDLGPKLNYTRYLSQTNATATATGACVEENADAPSRVHVKVELRNAGDAGFYVRDTDPSTTATTKPLPLRFRILDGFLPVGNFAGDAYDVSLEAGSDLDLVLAEAAYAMLDRAGDRALKVVVDSDASYAETDETNNEFTHTFRIAAADLAGEWVEQPERSGNAMTGTVRMRNIGDHEAGVAPTGADTSVAGICQSRDGGPVKARVYVDVIDAAHEVYNFVDNLTAGEASPDKSFTSETTLKAGTHRIIFIVDAVNFTGAANNVHELDETNNRIVADTILSVPDTKPPEIPAANLSVPAEGRVNERINISGDVLDDADFAAVDQNHIFVRVTYPNGTEIPHPVTDAPGVSGVIQDPDDDSDERYNWWWNTTYPEKGTYTVRIEAQDSLQSVLSAIHTFNLTEFPKNVQQVNVRVCRTPINATDTGDNNDFCQYNATSVVHQKFVPYSVTPGATSGTPVPGAPPTDTYNGNLVNLTFRVPAGATGLPNEHRNTNLKRVTLWDPDGVAVGNFAVTPVCWNNITSGQSVGAQEAASGCINNPPLATGQPDPTNSAFPCTDQTSNCHNFTFRVVFGVNASGDVQPTGVLGNPTMSCSGQAADAPQHIHLTKPGPWNLTMWVGDASEPCAFRANGFPEVPLYTFELWADPNTTIEGVTPGPSSTVNALTNFAPRADLMVNTTAGPLKQAVVEVYNANGTTLLGSYNMTPGSDVDPVNKTGVYSAAIGTGLGRDLDAAGTYRWLIAVKDANHTWTYSDGANGATCTPVTEDNCVPTKFSLSVADTRFPTVTNAVMTVADAGGLEATNIQAGTNATAQANVDDDTRITVEAVVQGDNGQELLRLPMRRQSAVGTLYVTENITTGAGGQLPEGSYRLVVHVVDSAGQVADAPAKAFAVAGNLGPSFSNLLPLPNGFGARAGTVTVDIGDPLQGVLANRTEVRVGRNGTATESVVLLTQTPLDTAVPPRAVRLTFQLSSQFLHGDNVTVNVTARDNSPEPLPGSVQWSFLVDGQAPRTAVTCTQAFPAACGTQGQQVAIRGDTSITLAATDQDPIVTSEVRAIRYTIEAAGQAPSTVEAPGANATFRLTQPARPDGAYTVRYQAIDLAGNVEPERSFAVILDTQGPQVQNLVRSQTPGGANVSAVITDVGFADVQRATLHFRTDVAGYQPVTMERIGETRGWFAEITSARRGTRVCYYIDASDFLGNVGSNGSSVAPECFNSENHPPRLTVTSPGDGEAVGASMTIRWETGDIDNDPVTVALSIRRAGDVQLRAIALSSEEQGRRSKTLPTTDLVAGTYQLRVDAVDNQQFNNRTTVVRNLTIGDANATSGLPTFDQAAVDIGQRVRVSVQIAKEVEDIQAQLQRDGAVVARAPMDQDPPGSITYVAEFVVRDPGVYRVVVVGTYADGTPFEIASASTLTVRGALPLDAMVIAGLAVVVVALAVVGLRRRGA